MKLVFVHGWSVTDIDTYAQLPEVLQEQASEELHLEVKNIYLGEYISFHDEVVLQDIARAFENARREQLKDEKFACITHSTGGPLIRLWIDLFYKNNLANLPLTHLVMLAPANHGSALAMLGKDKVGRIQAWFKGIEPGVGVLNWLELGSNEAWNLNDSWLEYTYENSFYPFVLSGEKIDSHFYDFLNHYLVEKGSDGVVRLSGANLNYQKLELKQYCDEEVFDATFHTQTIKAYPLKLQNGVQSSSNCAFEVIKNASHSGDRYGIMNSVKKNRVVKPVVFSILQALHVRSFEEYTNVSNEMISRTNNAQKDKNKFVMFIIHVRDNFGKVIKDYDMLLLAGAEYSPSELPKGFFVDRQKNAQSGNLTYYLNWSKLKEIKDGKIGIRITARPSQGFSSYYPAEFRANSKDLDKFLHANETIMVDIVLERIIATNTFVVETKEKIEKDFKHRKPSSDHIKL
jgi:GTPase SAR1 family protein